MFQTTVQGKPAKWFVDALALFGVCLLFLYTVISFAMRLKCMYMICSCFKILSVDLVYQAGAMLGDAFLHQLPHAFGTLQWISSY